MKLEQVIAAGAVINQELVKRPIKYHQKLNDGSIVVHDVDIYVKSAMSAADFDYIYVQKLADIEDVRLVKQVHRLVRLDHGTEVIPYVTALTLDPILLMAMIMEVNAVQGKNKTEKEVAEEELSAQEKAEKN